MYIILGRMDWRFKHENYLVADVSFKGHSFHSKYFQTAFCCCYPVIHVLNKM